MEPRPPTRPELPACLVRVLIPSRVKIDLCSILANPADRHKHNNMWAVCCVLCVACRVHVLGAARRTP